MLDYDHVTPFASMMAAMLTGQGQNQQRQDEIARQQANLDRDFAAQQAQQDRNYALQDREANRDWQLQNLQARRNYGQQQFQNQMNTQKALMDDAYRRQTMGMQLADKQEARDQALALAEARNAGINERLGTKNQADINRLGYQDALERQRLEDEFTLDQAKYSNETLDKTISEIQKLQLSPQGDQARSGVVSRARQLQAQLPTMDYEQRVEAISQMQEQIAQAHLNDYEIQDIPLEQQMQETVIVGQGTGQPGDLPKGVVLIKNPDGTFRPFQAKEEATVTTNDILQQRSRAAATLRARSASANTAITDEQIDAEIKRAEEIAAQRSTAAAPPPEEAAQPAAGNEQSSTTFNLPLDRNQAPQIDAAGMNELLNGLKHGTLGNGGFVMFNGQVYCVKGNKILKVTPK